MSSIFPDGFTVRVASMATSTTGMILAVVIEYRYPEAVTSGSTTSTPAKLGMGEDTLAILVMVTSENR